MDIDVIGVPMDYGAGRRGVDMGPSAIRYARLLQHLNELDHHVKDLGNLEVPFPESFTPNDPQLRHLDVVVNVLSKLAASTHRSVQSGRFPLVLGGDHSLALGSIRGASRDKSLGCCGLMLMRISTPISPQSVAIFTACRWQPSLAAAINGWCIWGKGVKTR